MKDLAVQASFKITDEQKDAISAMITFAQNKDKTIALSGAGGTGKSFIVKELIRCYEKMNIKYSLCAPTHKAASVLSEYTNRNVSTIHSLLKLSPNLNVEKLDFKCLKFCRPNLFKETVVLIVDESSMVNKELYEFLTKKYDKIIFIGDAKQLGPVNDSFDIFKTCKTHYLTKIFRQSEDSELLDILDRLRVEAVREFKSNNDVSVTNDIRSFVNEFVDDINNGKDSIIVCYTNKRVSDYNKVIMQRLFGHQEGVFPGMRVVGNYSTDGVANGQFYTIKSVKNKEDFTSFGKVDCKSINVNGNNFLYIDKRHPAFDMYSESLEEIRLKAIEKKTLWQEYYKMLSIFVSLDDFTIGDRIIKKSLFKPAYAMTTHKMQGSSAGTVYIDMRDMGTCRDDDTLRQLQYVAMSRATSSVKILV